MLHMNVSLNQIMSYTNGDEDVLKEKMREISYCFKKKGYSGCGFNLLVEEDEKLEEKHKNKIININQFSFEQEGNNNDDGDDESNNFYKGLKMGENKYFDCYSRITITLTNTKQIHYFSTASNSIIKSYDIIAVYPKNESVFSAVCSNLNIHVDIISIDFSHKLSFKLKHTYVKQAIAKGIYFEIVFPTSIEDNNYTSAMFSNIMHLIYVTKGKNIIISNQCNFSDLLSQQTFKENHNFYQNLNNIEILSNIKSPLDLISFAILIGIPHNKAKDVLSKNCKNIIIHGRTRKSSFGLLEIQKVSDLSLYEHWKLDNLKLVDIEKNNKRKLLSSSPSSNNNNNNDN
eukprot:TRINITY_DN1439_c0_g1_i1.p1 TRINITY_DN1439_c0_g1~~TRINITY_DN1439_c0_g1_i1.p1  ORF type:complete len:344 (-),score=62.19 TRINITY_DN1439_c0_g1_i1:46-1077(-)